MLPDVPSRTAEGLGDNFDCTLKVDGVPGRDTGVAVPLCGILAGERLDLPLHGVSGRLTGLAGLEPLPSFTKC